MPYLGRRGALAPLTSADIPAGIVEGTDVAFLENSSGQTLAGTYSTERMYLSGRTGSAPNDYNYKLEGDVTVTGHLALGTIADADVVITNDGTERTITTDASGGTLEAGNVLQDTHRTSLTDMTGELGSVVTGSPNLNLGNATFPAGHVLQVAQGENRAASTGTYVVHTATPSTWITVVSATITPSNVASKILINFTANLSGDGGSTALHILRDSTQIGQADAAGSRVRSTIANGHWEGGSGTYDMANYNGVFLDDISDSPAWTSGAITYYIKISKYNAGTYRINRSEAHRDNAAGYDGVSASYIVLQEIA
jgi:hypothetical protein